MSTLEYLDAKGTVNFLFVPWGVLNNWLSELNGNKYVVGTLREGVNRGKVLEELQNRKRGNRHHGFTGSLLHTVVDMGYGKDWLEYENEQGYTHFEELLIFQPHDWRKQAREYFFHFKCDLDRVSQSTDIRTVDVAITSGGDIDRIDISLTKPSLVVMLHPAIPPSHRHEPLNFLLAYDVPDPIPSLPISKDENHALLRHLSPLDYYFYFQENVQTYDLDSLRSISRLSKHLRLTLIKELDFANVIGQRMAKHMIRQEVVNHFWKMSDSDGLCVQRHPLSMIFSGPSGNGKTELAKELANLMNPPNKDAFLKVDCGKLTDVSEIFGRSGAYQGAEEGSALNNFVLRMASDPDIVGVVLLDEIEKGNREVIYALYQVLDKGEWTNKKLERGRSHTATIPCNNLIFIMTTNAAAELVIDFATERSVHSVRAFNMEDVSHEVENRIRSRLQNTHPFTDAFIGRVGRIVPFFPMANKDLHDGLLGGEMMVVAKLLIEREQERLLADGSLKVEQFVSAEEKHEIARLAVEQSIPESGVRSLQQWVERTMGKKMRHSLLLKKGGINPGAQICYFAYKYEKKVGYRELTSGKCTLGQDDQQDEHDTSLYE